MFHLQNGPCSFGTFPSAMISIHMTEIACVNFLETVVITKNIGLSRICRSTFFRANAWASLDPMELVSRHCCVCYPASPHQRRGPFKLKETSRRCSIWGWGSTLHLQV